MLPVRFEPTISADERPQTYALDRAATGIGPSLSQVPQNELCFHVLEGCFQNQFTVTVRKKYRSISFDKQEEKLKLGRRKLKILALDNQDIFLSSKTSTTYPLKTHLCTTAPINNTGNLAFVAVEKQYYTF
jgi:hypothetical protein